MKKKDSTEINDSLIMRGNREARARVNVGTNLRDKKLQHKNQIWEKDQ